MQHATVSTSGHLLHYVDHYIRLIYMRVIQTIQSTLPRNTGAEADDLPDPVEFAWYKGDNLAEALVSLMQAAGASHDRYYRTLSVRIDFEDK